MKVNSIYHQGSAPDREDGMVCSWPLFGVLDGVSAPYGPAYPMRRFGGLSGGELVSRTAEQLFGGRPGFRETILRKYLKDIISSVNVRVACVQIEAGVPQDVGELAGAAFAIAKVGEESVEIVQAGDCFALWVTCDGNAHITRNQVRLHDAEMNAEILRLQRKVARELGIALEDANPEERSVIRGEMWNRFAESLKQARRAAVNNPASPHCYGLMNGDHRLLEVMSSLSLSRKLVRTALLFSDGMVPWEAMKGMTDEEVAERVCADYQEGGLAQLLRVARGIERRVANVNYIDSAEATAIALDFSDERR